MQSSVDHVALSVSDLRLGTHTFTSLGFEFASDDAHGPRIDTETASVVLTASQAVSGSGSIAVASEEFPSELNDRLAVRFVSTTRQNKRPGNHPNGVLRLERIYIVVPDLQIAAPEYASALRMQLRPQQRGNVIKATMQVFDVGPVGIVVAQPAEPGPAADAFAQRGAGLFQLLFRVRHLADVGRWMVKHGLPEPVHGTRNTGESAILVRPEYACGVYVAFVGPD